MQKVIVNGRFLLHRITGVERYAREVLAELDRIIQPEEIQLAVPPGVENIPVFNNIQVVRIDGLHNRLWEHISFPAYVKKQNAISLNLCNVAPLAAPGIVAIFDMKIREHPEFFSKKFLLWYRLLYANETKRAKLIFTDSFSAKLDILRYYDVPAEKIIVAPCAWQHYERVAYDESTLKKYGVTKGEFFFAMGSLDPNKNFKWVAEAAKNNPDKQFVVAGSINEAVFANGMGFPCPENMKLLGYISDKEAKTLMRDCKAFLFPSFCEGFGIPPLEALSAGANSIVVSDIPVMHEIFGGSAAYVNPQVSPTAIDTKAISTADRERILKKYSWRNTACIVKEAICK